MFDAAASQDRTLLSNQSMDIEGLVADVDTPHHYNETILEKSKENNNSVSPTTLEVIDPVNSEDAGAETLCHTDNATNAESQFDSTNSNTALDQFLISITTPLPQPLLASHPTQKEHHTPPEVETPPCRASSLPDTTMDQTQNLHSEQRKSSRLADKAKETQGKRYVQLAQEVLAKKLGNLSPPTKISESDLFNSYAQHLEQPLTKQNMEALTVLVGHGIHPKKKKGRTSKVTPIVHLPA
jgi:hypothetical protein